MKKLPSILLVLAASAQAQVSSGGGGGGGVSSGGGGSSHPALKVLPSSGAPMLWSPATQTLRMPQSPTAFWSASGTMTFTHGDGNAANFNPVGYQTVVSGSSAGTGPVFNVSTSGTLHYRNLSGTWQPVVVGSTTTASEGLTATGPNITLGGAVTSARTLALGAGGVIIFDAAAAGASGIRLTDVTSASAPVVGAQPLGVDASGNVVRAAAPLGGNQIAVLHGAATGVEITFENLRMRHNAGTDQFQIATVTGTDSVHWFEEITEGGETFAFTGGFTGLAQQSNTATPITTTFTAIGDAGLTGNNRLNFTLRKASTGEKYEVRIWRRGTATVFDYDVFKYGITGATVLTANNGTNISGSEIRLGGALSVPTAITTTATNTLTLSGLQGAVAADTPIQATAAGALRRGPLDLTSAAKFTGAPINQIPFGELTGTTGQLQFSPNFMVGGGITGANSSVALRSTGSVWATETLSSAIGGGIRVRDGQTGTTPQMILSLARVSATNTYARLQAVGESAPNSLIQDWFTNQAGGSYPAGRVGTALSQSQASTTLDSITASWVPGTPGVRMGLNQVASGLPPRAFNVRWVNAAENGLGVSGLGALAEALAFMNAVNAPIGSVTTNALGTGVAYNTTSDERLKRLVPGDTDALGIINKILPRSFLWKEPKHIGETLAAEEIVMDAWSRRPKVDAKRQAALEAQSERTASEAEELEALTLTRREQALIDDRKAGVDAAYRQRLAFTKQAPSYGVFAQELYGVLPSAVTVGDGDKPWQVDYSSLVPYLIRATQQLTERVEALEKK